MNITVIGASAGVGLQTVKRALERNHIVTTLSRSEIKLPKYKNLHIIKGSATSRPDVLNAIKNADAVIVSLGTGKSLKSTTLYSDFAGIFVAILSETNSKIPLIILTGFGAGDSWNYQPNFMMKMFFKFLLKDVYTDKSRMEEIITTSGLQWTIVRPGLLNNKPLTEKYKVETHLYKGIKVKSIGRSDVADFMVKEAENKKYSFNYVSLSNK